MVSLRQGVRVPAMDVSLFICRQDAPQHQRPDALAGADGAQPAQLCQLYQQRAARRGSREPVYQTRRRPGHPGWGAAGQRVDQQGRAADEPLVSRACDRKHPPWYSCHVCAAAATKSSLNPFQAIFQTTVQAQLTGNSKQLRLVDKARFDTLVRVVMTCSTTALLIASSLALPLAQQAGYESEAVLLLLTGVFAVLVAVFADATRGELFAATVGYVDFCLSRVD